MLIFPKPLNTANINKTANAAAKQINDIEFIEKKTGFAKLSNGLDEMARVRLQYPTATLQELGKLLDPPVGKSGVNTLFDMMVLLCC